MIGVPGTAQRLFGALREEGISVILISQGSSSTRSASRFRKSKPSAPQRVVRRAFDRRAARGPDPERRRGRRLQHPRGRRRRHGRRARRRGAGCSARWAAAGVNVRAIAQGASERNISVGDRRAQTTPRAARRARGVLPVAAHDLDRPDRAGLVGGGAARAARVAGERLRRDFKLDLRVRGIAGRSACCSRRAVDRRSTSWREQRSARADAVDLDRFAAHVHAEHVPHTVIIDCTASADVAERYAELARGGIHVVTPNKKANSGRVRLLRAMLRAARRAHGAHYLYEATVGAGPADHRRRCATCARPATRSSASKASSPARSPTSSTSGTAASRSPRWSCGSQGAGLHGARSARRPVRASTSRAS